MRQSPFKSPPSSSTFITMGMPPISSRSTALYCDYVCVCEMREGSREKGRWKVLKRKRRQDHLDERQKAKDLQINTHLHTHTHTHTHRQK